MDPTTQALMAAGLGLLGTRGSAGFGRAGLMGLNQLEAAKKMQLLEEESRQREAERKSMAALRDAQIANALAQTEQRKALAARGIDPDEPKDVTAAKWFMGLPSDQQRTALQWRRGDDKLMELNGVLSRISQSGLGGSPQPLTTLGEEASAQATIAGSKKRAEEQQRASFDLVPNFDRGSGQVRLTPRSELLGSGGGGVPAGDLAKLPPELQQALRGVQVPPAGGGALDPRQQEIDKEAAKRKESAQASLNVVDNTLKQIDKALSQVGTFTTGVPGQVLGRIAGTPAFNLRATAQTIKANLGFDRLQVMRDASPTGGALGQVAIQELEALQSSIGNLDPAQSPEQLIENLKAVQGHYQRWRGTLQGKAGADGTTDAGPDDELKALRRKYGLN